MAGSTLGLLFTVTNFGESHGPAIGCVIDALLGTQAQPEDLTQLDERADAGVAGDHPGTEGRENALNERDRVAIAVAGA